MPDTPTEKDKPKEILTDKNEILRCLKDGQSFEGVQIDNVSFERHIFPYKVDFSGAIFGDEVDFSQAVFEQGAFFCKTTFEFDVDFRGADFKDGINCSEAHFSGKANFAELYPNLVYDRI